MTAVDRWLDELGPDDREATLPKWAQERLRALRRAVTKYQDGVENEQSTRVALRLGGDGQGGGLYRGLPDNTDIRMQITGGCAWVGLSRFGDRYRLRITGMADYDELVGDRAEIAMLPALGNVVEFGFVMPVADTLRLNSRGALEQATPEGASISRGTGS